MKLNLYKQVEVRLPRARLLRLFDTVYRRESPASRHGHVNLVFTTDARLRQLNRQYRGKDKPTDVLSFNIDEPKSAESVFGEIYISVPIARKQAAGYGAPLSEELLRLACHGFLHLLGYDHHKSADERVMKNREDRYLKQVVRR